MRAAAPRGSRHRCCTPSSPPRRRWSESTVVDDIFPTRDGAVAITCRSEAEWATLCDALGVSGGTDAEGNTLRDVRGGTDAEGNTLSDVPGGTDARRLLAAQLATAPSAAWVKLLARQGIPCARAVADDDALARADLWRIGALRQLTLPHAPSIVTGGAPWDLGDARAACRAPLPGADTAAAAQGVREPSELPA